MKDKYIGKYDSVFKELLEKREEQRLIDKIRTESERDKCLRKMQEVIDGLTGDTMKAVDIAKYIISNNLINNLIRFATNYKSYLTQSHLFLKQK